MRALSSITFQGDLSLTSDNLLSNDQQTIGFGSCQVGFRDASIRGSRVGVSERGLGRLDERGYRLIEGGAWTGKLVSVDG